jgi:hypothetical protein
MIPKNRTKSVHTQYVERHGEQDALVYPKFFYFYAQNLALSLHETRETGM